MTSSRSDFALQLKRSQNALRVVRAGDKRATVLHAQKRAVSEGAPKQKVVKPALNKHGLARYTATHSEGFNASNALLQSAQRSSVQIPGGSKAAAISKNALATKRFVLRRGISQSATFGATVGVTFGKNYLGQRPAPSSAPSSVPSSVPSSAPSSVLGSAPIGGAMQTAAQTPTQSSAPAPIDTPSVQVNSVQVNSVQVNSVQVNTPTEQAPGTPPSIQPSANSAAPSGSENAAQANVAPVPVDANAEATLPEAPVQGATPPRSGHLLPEPLNDLVSITLFTKIGASLRGLGSFVRVMLSSSKKLISEMSDAELQQFTSARLDYKALKKLEQKGTPAVVATSTPPQNEVPTTPATPETLSDESGDARTARLEAVRKALEENTVAEEYLKDAPAGTDAALSVPGIATPGVPLAQTPGINVPSVGIPVDVSAQADQTAPEAQQEAQVPAEETVQTPEESSKELGKKLGKKLGGDEIPAVETTLDLYDKPLDGDIPVDGLAANENDGASEENAYQIPITSELPIVRAYTPPKKPVNVAPVAEEVSPEENVLPITQDIPVVMAHTQQLPIVRVVKTMQNATTILPVSENITEPVVKEHEEVRSHEEARSKASQVAKTPEMLNAPEAEQLENVPETPENAVLEARNTPAEKPAEQSPAKPDVKAEQADREKVDLVDSQVINPMKRVLKKKRIPSPLALLQAASAKPDTDATVAIKPVTQAEPTAGEEIITTTEPLPFAPLMEQDLRAPAQNIDQSTRASQEARQEARQEVGEDAPINTTIPLKASAIRQRLSKPIRPGIRLSDTIASLTSPESDARASTTATSIETPTATPEQAPAKPSAPRAPQTKTPRAKDTAKPASDFAMLRKSVSDIMSDIMDDVYGPRRSYKAGTSEIDIPAARSVPQAPTRDTEFSINTASKPKDRTPVHISFPSERRLPELAPETPEHQTASARSSSSASSSMGASTSASTTRKTNAFSNSILKSSQPLTSASTIPTFGRSKKGDPLAAFEDILSEIDSKTHSAHSLISSNAKKASSQMQARFDDVSNPLDAFKRGSKS